MAHAKYQGYAGHVATRRNRITHNLVSVYDAEAQQLDTEAGKWAVVCEQHGAIVNTNSKKVALGSMSYPDWCEDCRDLLP